MRKRRLLVAGIAAAALAVGTPVVALAMSGSGDPGTPPESGQPPVAVTTPSVPGGQVTTPSVPGGQPPVTYPPGAEPPVTYPPGTPAPPTTAPAPGPPVTSPAPGGAGK